MYVNCIKFTAFNSLLAKYRFAIGASRVRHISAGLADFGNWRRPQEWLQR